MFKVVIDRHDFKDFQWGPLFCLSTSHQLFSLSKVISNLLPNSLPEVPPLSEVACIYVETPEVLRQQLLTDVSDYGRVIARAPVQIASITERPGSLVIRWAEVGFLFFWEFNTF